MGTAGSSDPLSSEELDKYGFVVSSSQRQSVLKYLHSNPSTPKQISVSTDIHLSHISNLLSELGDEGIVVCVNPERKKGRIYKLTKTGNRIVEVINKDD